MSSVVQTVFVHTDKCTCSPQVMVKMVATDGSGNDWLWDRNKFINRKYIMQEMYANFVEGDEDWDLPQVGCTPLLSVVRK